MKGILLEIPESFNQQDIDYLMVDCVDAVFQKYHDVEKRKQLLKMFYSYYYSDNIQITYKN